MSNLRTGIVLVLATSFGGLVLADRVWGSPEGHDLEQRLARLEQERAALGELSRSLRGERARMQDDRRVMAWNRERSSANHGVLAQPLGDPSARTSASADEPTQAWVEPREAPPPPPTMEEVQEDLEQVFVDRTDDPAWSRDAEQRVLDGLHSKIDERTELASVECNGTLCRVESDHDDMSSFRDFAENTVLGSSGELWRGAVFTSVVEGAEGGGSVTAVTFMAREGESLPGISG